MEYSESPVDLLLLAFKERDILTKRDDIQSAFQGSNQNDRSSRWLSEHLQYDTLLSKEEFCLYSRLESSGDLAGIGHDPDIDVIRPLLDEDLQGAVESLHASTAVLEKQTQILTSQFQTISKQFCPQNDRRASQSGGLALLQRKYALGSQRINAVASDVAHEFEGSLKRETENTTAEGEKILSFVARLLKENDRVLTHLETLASEVKSTGSDFSAMRHASQLSGILADYVAGELYYRLDRLYLWEMQTPKPNSEELWAVADEAMAALAEDLESLYLEIDVLAQMSASEQFNKPILRELQNHRNHEHAVSHKTLGLVVDLITEITSSAGNIAARLQHRQSFCETLRVLVTLYQKTNLCDQSLDHPSEHKDSKRRFIQTAVSSPSTESATRLPEAQPLEPLLRRFGLSPEALFESNEPSMSAYSLYEKMLNMHDCLRSLDIVADSMVASELARADSANQRLSSSVNSNSRFEITLSSVDQERQLSCLEARLGLAQRGTEYLDLDVLYQRDRTQGRFMDQWA